MARIDTLTAYACKFCYMERNNPLIHEQRKAIKEGKAPQYTFSDFFADYTKIASKLAIGENSDRAILLSSKNILTETIGQNVQRIHFIPSAGKHGRPVKVMKKTTLKEYDFGSDSAALYDHHVFIYEGDKVCIAIFHRLNGSGCKSVFLETANKVLREKGIKLDMELLVPNSDSLLKATPTKITLQYTRPISSTDIADHAKGSKKKKEIIRELGLNLEVTDNNSVFKIFRNMQLGKIDQSVAFAQIKAECPDSEEYNDAEIMVRIGGRKKSVPWNELEGSLGSFDITNALRKAYKQPEDYIPALIKLADEYYNNIIETEGVEDVN